MEILSKKKIDRKINWKDFDIFYFIQLFYRELSILDKKKKPDDRSILDSLKMFPFVFVFVFKAYLCIENVKKNHFQAGLFRYSRSLCATVCVCITIFSITQKLKVVKSLFWSKTLVKYFFTTKTDYIYDFVTLEIIKSNKNRNFIWRAIEQL